MYSHAQIPVCRIVEKRLGKSPAQFAAWNPSSASMLKYFDILSIH